VSLPLLFALSAPDLSPLPGADVGSALRSLAAVFVVLGLVALCAWLVRRGTFGALGSRAASSVRVETSVPLGDRRSLLVVSVEVRRLLLGLTPQQVTLVTELGGTAPAFTDSLARATSGGAGPAAGGRS
jgi:flagellar protein FliO/FliZ